METKARPDAGTSSKLTCVVCGQEYERREIGFVDVARRRHTASSTYVTVCIFCLSSCALVFAGGKDDRQRPLGKDDSSFGESENE